MESIAFDFLKSTAAGIVFGMFVGILMLAWLRVVDRWLADGIDTVTTDEWWQPLGEQYAQQGKSITPRTRATARRSAAMKKPNSAPDLQRGPIPAETSEWDSLRRDAARRDSLKGLDRISLRWRDDSENDSLDPWSRRESGSRQQRHPGEIELGN